LLACIGHVNIASDYLENVAVTEAGLDDNSSFRKPDLAPLASCLQSLKWVCRTALPLLPGLISPTRYQTNFCSISSVESPAVLQNLLDLLNTNDQIEQLIWDPVTAYRRRVSARMIHSFQETLLNWNHQHLHLFPERDLEYDPDDAGHDREIYSLPPQGHLTSSSCASIAAAHYSFYMARLKWALCILGEDSKRSEMSANYYFFEAMRFAAIFSETTPNVAIYKDVYLPCEALKVGFLPLLHLTGLCCPRPSWLHWIRDYCSLIRQEGVFKGHTFSTNLECFHMFELLGTKGASLEQYSAPASRVICQLIPESDGRHYMSYFARPTVEVDPNLDGLDGHSPLGHARWRCNFGEHPCSPDVHIYGEESLGDRTTNWSSKSPAAVAWHEWSKHTEFSMDCALRNHINGSRLLPPS
jgi:hypothetical protein